MDDSQQIIAKLQQKLEELDVKVGRYKADLIGEYQRFADSTLTGVSEAVSARVVRSIHLAMPAYRNLYHDVAEPAAAGRDTGKNEQGMGEPPHGAGSHENSSSIAAWDAEADVALSPLQAHVVGSTEKRWSERPQGILPVSGVPRADPGSSQDGALSDLLDATSLDHTPLINATNLARPHTLSRHNTDDTSVLSDTSGGTVRRGAFRRTSSSPSRHSSPRRVRLALEGKEFLPTTSPGRALEHKVLDKEVYVRMNDDPGDYLQDPDSPPRRKKSSTQRLRELGKAQPIDPNEWVTYQSGPNGSAAVVADKLTLPTIESLESIDGMDAVAVPGAPVEDTQFLEQRGPRMVSSKAIPTSIVSDYDESSEEELLISARRKPAASKANAPAANARSLLSTMTSSRNDMTVADPTTKHGTREMPTDGIGDLNFMEESSARPSPVYSSESEHEETDGRRGASTAMQIPAAASTSTLSPTRSKGPAASDLFATSPARAIPRPSTLRPPSPPVRGIIGSYKGQPIGMPSVSDEVHAQAALMGNISSFVGSMRGADRRSDRNGQSATGRSRGLSMTERMNLEDQEVMK